MHTYRFLSSTFIFYERTDADAGFRKISSVLGLRIAAGGGIYRFDPEAVWLDVYGIRCAKIYVTIDPGTGIPACAVRNMDARKNLILSSILEKAVGFDIKRHVTIVLAYRKIPINVNQCIFVHAFEIEANGFFLPFLRDHECFSISSARNSRKTHR